jgi:long-chain acyl-CoA synthetase
MWELTLPDVLAQHARSRPDQLAAVCGEVRLRWPELDARARQLAGALAGAGARRGDRVVWAAQGCHRVLEALLACGYVGAVFCPVNWRQTSDELAFVLDDASPRVVFWQEAEIGATVRAARQVAPGSATWVCHDDGGYERFLAGAEPVTEVAAEASDGVLMIYTGAFSGRPNGAVLSHRAVLAQDLVITHVNGVDCSDVFLNSGPLFHLGTLMRTFATFHLGGTNVFVARVEPQELCRLVEQERCTGAFLMPPTMAQMVEANRDGRYDLKSLRSAGGPPGWDDMVTIDPSPRPAGGTGQTEVMGLVTFQAFGGTGAHGRPSPMAQVRVHDEDGTECAPGEVGEIVVRGPVVCNGYHNRPELNAAKQRGGWWHTGDLGRVEADGSVTFIGPKARMIKSAAENIYPAEVESCLTSHPAVREAAVIGVPDDVWAQSVKAIVAVREGMAVTPDELIAHCRERIASYKKPRTVEFVDALPRLGYAVDYDALDASFGGGGYPGGWNRSV